jgi:hypothetical protein
MGLFDELQNTPEVPEDNQLLQSRGESLEAPEVSPETPEEALLVARSGRKAVEQEEGMEFGTPVDFAEQFNNTLISAIGAPVDLTTWALNGASKLLGGPELIDPETAVGGSASLKSVLNPLGIGSDREADTYMGYAGNTFGEAAAFLAGGAGVVQKTKQAKGVIGSISKQADEALRTKLDDVVAVEATAALGMAGGRQYAEENEMGATGSLVLEFTTGALAMVSGAAAKKTVLDPLTAKLKNMTQKEALEKLSKEEVAEVVAEGQRVIAKEEPSPKKTPEPEEAPEAPEASATTATPKDTPEGRTIYRAENVGQADDGLGLPFYTEDKTYADLYMGEGRVLKEAQIPENVVDIRQPEGRAKVRKWAEAKIKDLEEAGNTDDFLRGAKKALNEDSPEASAKLLANLTLSINKQAGRGLSPSGVAERQFLTETGNSAMTMKEAGREIDEYSYAILPEKVKAPATPKDTPEPTPAPKTPEVEFTEGGIPYKAEGTYVRFGELPEGPSKNHLTGKDEKGHSVYLAYRDEKTGKYILQPNASDETASGEIIETLDALITGDRKIYEISGERIGEGFDGEPLLNSASSKQVREVDPSDIVLSSDRTKNIKGEELDVEASYDTTRATKDVPEDAEISDYSYKKRDDGNYEIYENGESRGIIVGNEATAQNTVNQLISADIATAKVRARRAAKEAPAPKTPEAAPKEDPTSASGDAIDASIKATREILEGDRSGGKGAQVTRKVKTHFRAVAKEFFDDVNTLIKTKDVEAAKKILSRIDKYIEFDRVISEKDYAQGSELVANRRNAMDFEFQAGISAAGNKRTEDLNVLKGMLQKLVDEDVAVDPKLVKQVAKDTKKRSEGAPKLSKEEKLDAIADQVAKTFVEERGGVFQQAIDGYFTVRLTQMLNQAKTAFVGVPSAFLMSVARPIVNTPYNIAKAAQLKGVTFSKRVQYATADIAGTYEYVRMITKHLGDTLRSSKDTILNKGDSNFLYRDRNAYIKDQLAEANEPSHTVKRRLKQVQRREAARNAKTDLGRKVLNARATVMNSKLAQVPAFFFDYGVSLIGGLEEISLIAHSMRAARAQGIKKGIDDGVDDVWKFSEDYMESAFDRSRGGLQAKYDPEYADIFNTARRDHFRAMDLDPSDIRKDMIDGLIAGLNKVSSNPDEMGLLARTLFVFIGVPMRALGGNVSYIASPLNVAKNVAGGGARRLETALGGKATFGKYNKRISELELDIKGQKRALKSQDPEVAKTAEKKLAELEDQLTRVKDLKMQKDYEDLGKMGVGAGLFFLGYEMAKNGQVAGTDSWMTEEQKLAAQKVQGAPNPWKIVLGGNEFDFKYFEPLKGVFALGADYARRQAAEEAGALTEDQTITQFFTSVTKSIATDSPFATGARYLTQVMSPNPETQERGVMGVVRSLIPVPAEVRNFNKFDEEFVTDTTAGEFADTVLSASLGQETGNYRLTSLGEPKIKEEPSILSYMLPFGPKAVPEREPIDDILLEDAMSFRSVSAPQTSISGFKLKNYVNEDNETLYSLYGRLITETRISGKTQRQALNRLVKTSDFKRAYNNNKYTMDDKGAEINEGIEMIKDIISEYRAEARSQILENKAANDYVDSDGNNIYDILKEREEFSEQPESLLESLNLQ